MSLTPSESPTPTEEEVRDALRRRLLEAIQSSTTTSETVLTLAEAYAWLSEPGQPHGAGRG